MKFGSFSKTKNYAVWGTCLFAAIVILMFQNCAGGFANQPTTNSSTTGFVNGLILSASKDVLPTTGTLQLNITGGTVPYTYTVVGGGSISPTGLYTAPSSITGSSVQVTINGYDSTDLSGTFTIKIVPGMTLSVNYSPSNPTINTVVDLSTTGGKAPYSYYLEPGSTSGSGEMGSASYTTGQIAGTDTIEVTDANGDTASVTITVSVN